MRRSALLVVMISIASMLALVSCSEECSYE